MQKNFKKNFHLPLTKINHNSPQNVTDSVIFYPRAENFISTRACHFYL